MIVFLLIPSFLWSLYSHDLTRGRVQVVQFLFIFYWLGFLSMLSTHVTVHLLALEEACNPRCHAAMVGGAELLWIVCAF